MRITEPMSREAYLVAREVYRGSLQREAGISDLVARMRMNRGSAGDLINNLRHMLQGEVYHRTLNYYTTHYYLQRIHEDFGEAAYRRALSALEKHLDYYDSLGRSRQVKLREFLREAVHEPEDMPVYPDEVDPRLRLIEGARREVTVNGYERNPRARRICLDEYGYRCVVCQIDFKEVYGEIGCGFIHVHHVVELSNIGHEYVIDPLRDLCPVCPNCHAMLHKEKPALSVDELRLRLTDAPAAR